MMDVKTAVKEGKIQGVLTSAQILLVHKQIQKIVLCEGGEIEKDWNTVKSSIKIVDSIPWSKWCLDCLHKFDILKQLIQKMMDKNNKSILKGALDKIDFKLEYPLEDK